MRASHGAAWRVRIRAAAAVAILGAIVSSCSDTTSQDITQMTCPRVIAAPGTDTIALFRPGGHSAQDVMVRGKIYQASVHCETEKTGVAAHAELTFYAERAGLQITDATLPYFVAVVDPTQKVLAQEGFHVHVDFLPGEPYRKLPAEKITIHLPVHSTAAASNYAVVVGFQLTPDQLAYNRSSRTQ
ncbi:MAG TPA: hypothetical protein VMU87_21425 [Stellaceae bacterium]|nr:hypothetical protein [Stellaceae bacterium]